MNSITPNPSTSQDNNRITPLFGVFRPVQYNAQESTYFQQFDGEDFNPEFDAINNHTWFQYITTLNFDSDVVKALDSLLEEWAELTIQKVMQDWYVLRFTDFFRENTRLVSWFANRADAYMYAIWLMAKEDEYRAFYSEEPQPDIDAARQKLADWNAKVRATLSVVPQDANGGNHG